MSAARKLLSSLPNTVRNFIEAMFLDVLTDKDFLKAEKAHKMASSVH